MSNQNLRVFQRGAKLIYNQIWHNLRPVLRDAAKDLLWDAIKLWENNSILGADAHSDDEGVRDGYNMTGNLINSYIVGMYKEGSLVDVIYPYEVGITDRPTAPYSYPNDKIYVWHQYTLDYDSLEQRERYSEDIGKRTIKQYNQKKWAGVRFQKVGRGKGDEDAKKLLKSLHPQNFASLVVAVGVPYAEYIENVRKLHVLAESAQPSNVGSIVTPYLKSAGFDVR